MRRGEGLQRRREGLMRRREGWAMALRKRSEGVIMIGNVL